MLIALPPTALRAGAEVPSHRCSANATVTQDIATTHNRNSAPTPRQRSANAAPTPRWSAAQTCALYDHAVSVVVHHLKSMTTTLHITYRQMAMLLTERKGTMQQCTLNSFLGVVRPRPGKENAINISSDDEAPMVGRPAQRSRYLQDEAEESECSDDSFVVSDHISDGSGDSVRLALQSAVASLRNRRQFRDTTNACPECWRLSKVIKDFLEQLQISVHTAPPAHHHQDSSADEL